jgi:hypothetical protein
MLNFKDKYGSTVENEKWSSDRIAFEFGRWMKEKKNSLFLKNIYIYIYYFFNFILQSFLL